MLLLVYPVDLHTIYKQEFVFLNAIPDLIMLKYFYYSIIIFIFSQLYQKLVFLACHIALLVLQQLNVQHVPLVMYGILQALHALQLALMALIIIQQLQFKLNFFKYFIVFIKACSPCGTNCATCDNPTTCLTCVTGYNMSSPGVCT